MNTKHTQGPWAMEKKETLKYDPDTGAQRTPVVEFRIGHGEKNEFVAMTIASIDRNAEANALLIAAAPLMLEALENALGAFNERECSCDFEDGPDGPRGRACYFHRIQDEVKRAIVKATGKTP